MPAGETASAIAGYKIAGYAGIMGLFEFLGIPEQQITILAVLMVIDFITGVAKQFRVDRTKITSYHASLGLIKKIMTFTSVLTIGLVLRGLNIDSNVYVTGALSIFITAEGYSIISNVYAVRTGVILPEFDVVSIFLKNFGDFIKKRIEVVVKPPNDPQV